MNHGYAEGVQNDKRANDASEVSFTKPYGGPVDDSLPLDGSLSHKDTEPENQEGLHPDETRVLVGSELTSTAAGAVDVSVVPPPDKLQDNQTANEANR